LPAGAPSIKEKLSMVRSLLTIVAALMLPAGAIAQSETKGFYASVYGQFSRLSDTSFDLVGAGNGRTPVGAEFDNGFGAGGDFGYRYGNGWAAEIEWNYRSHDLKTLTAGGSTLTREGDFASNTILVNGLRRFPQGAWTPYAGLGLGWVQEIDLDLEGQSAGSYSQRGKWAVQLIAGAEYALSKQWLLTADLRYLRVGAVQLEGPNGARLSSPDYNPLSAQVGLRYRF
jgi:opacity protein-like surface antigen